MTATRTSIAILHLAAACVLVGSSRGAETVLPVSAADKPSTSAAGGSFLPVFSDDGRHVVFLSHARNLVTNDDLALSLNVFRHDIELGRNELVSVNVSGIGGGDADAISFSVSSNSEWIVFASRASNLVTNDGNGFVDIFARHQGVSDTVLISADGNGQSPSGTPSFWNRALSGNPHISRDGRKVAFDSAAIDLASILDTNGTNDVFVRDIESGMVSCVSIAHDGTNTAAGMSHSPQMSADGRFVAFISAATNLVATGETNQLGDIYVRDLQLQLTFWASPGTRRLLVGPFPGLPRTYSCFNYALSANGEAVVYQASPTQSDAFSVLLYNAVGSTNTVRIALYLDAVGSPQISFDGQFVSFSSRSNVYLWDRLTGSNTLVSANTNGALANGPSHSPVMTPDGRFIAFLSRASDLTTNAATNRFQIYVRDNTAGVTRLVSVNTNGEPSVGGFEVCNLAISPDGRQVAFDSSVADLVPSDLNAASDVFVRDLITEQTRLISLAVESLPARTAAPMSGTAPATVSADGNVIAFTSFDSPFIADDTNLWQDILIRDLMAGSLQRITGDAAYVALDSPQVLRDPVLSAEGGHLVYAFYVPFGASKHLLWRDLVTQTNLLLNRGDPRDPPASVSSNGQIVVFESRIGVPSLIEGLTDFNGTDPDIFYRDIAAAETKLVSVNYAGTGSGNAASSNALLSPDARWVVFESRASDFLETNTWFGIPTLYARDLQSSMTEMVSIKPDGSPQQLGRGRASFSGNSRFVAFTGDNRAVVRRDLETKVSAPVCSRCENPAVSADGRFIAYESFGSIKQIYITDMQSGIAKLISANSSGMAGNGHSRDPQISPTGRFIVFESVASNLAANDNNSAADIFVADRVLGTVLLLTVNSSGTGSGNARSSNPSLSAEGRTVVFQSFANDLITGDYNDRRDVFVARLSAPDSDGDGMDDDFEVAHFGNLLKDGGGDADDDGHTDLQEFLAGTNPTNDESILRVITIMAAGESARRLVWSSTAGRSYAVQFKDDLNEPWSTLSGSVRATTSTATALDISSQPQRFYRVVLAE